MKFKVSFTKIQPKLSKETVRIPDITLSKLESVYKRHTSSVVAVLLSLYFIFVNNFKGILNRIPNVIRHTVYRVQRFTVDSDRYLSKEETPLTERFTNFHSGLLTLRSLTAYSVPAHISQTT